MVSVPGDKSHGSGGTYEIKSIKIYFKCTAKCNIWFGFFNWDCEGISYQDKTMRKKVT